VIRGNPAASFLAFAALLACGPRVDLEREASGIRWDKLSGRVAYARWDEPESSDPRGLIFLVDVPTRRVTLVRDVRTTGKPPSFMPTGWVGQLTFNPGGSAVTFSVLNDALNWELRSRALDSGAEQVLFPDPNAHHGFPAWSPDGRLAYYSKGADGVHLFIDGQFVLSHCWTSRIAWLAAGSFIDSLSNASSQGALYRVEPATQSVTPLVTAAPGEVFHAPAVAAGVGKLAYVRFGQGADGDEIWIAGLDGSNPVRLTHGYTDFEPAWSADGRVLLFGRRKVGLFIYELASGAFTQVTRAPAETMSWAP
jgi:Tol biopolymer transport system component